MASRWWFPGLDLERADRLYLGELYVVPGSRGHGLGRALLEASIEAARDAGAEVIDLNTSEDDTEAMRLYESAGFTTARAARTARGCATTSARSKAPSSDPPPLFLPPFITALRGLRQRENGA